LQERCKETQIAKRLLKFTHFVLAVGKDDLVGKAGTLYQSYEGLFLAWSLNCQEDHRMVGVGKDICGSSSPTLLLKQGHLQ